MLFLSTLAFHIYKHGFNIAAIYFILFSMLIQNPTRYPGHFCLKHELNVDNGTYAIV